ncbi:hypothetical protein ACIBF6_36970 [Streptosporangium amethystogenes]|uniref:hypothetical protein n=1 Tax=Streptosporangium amethystogenes TaxID=2002 RepID=UPI003794D4AE
MVLLTTTAIGTVGTCHQHSSDSGSRSLDGGPRRGDLGVRVDEASFRTPLSCTSYVMADFARDHGDKGAPYRWGEERRFRLRADLDAACFHLYDVVRDDLDTARSLLLVRMNAQLSGRP